jgi:peptidyl-prolyl cis-trans isomerase D
MLDTLRQGAQGWVSKVLMGLLVLSFAIWGVGGFEGYGSGTLATVGDSEVTVQEFANLYDQAQRNAQQSGQRVTADQVLAQLLATAAVDDEASRYGLGISSDRVAREIAKNQAFQSSSGVFDRERFQALLMNARMNPDDFIEDVRRNLVRGQIAESIGAGMEAPKPMVEAIYRLRNEERTISYLVVDDAAIEPVGEPGEAALQAYFEENKARFRAPEYRKVALLTLDPAAIAEPEALTEEALKAEYERRKAGFEQPERRRVEQIRFDDAASAEAALKKVQEGQTFAAVATESGKEVTDLGLKTKAEFIDAAMAEAAFGAAVNTPLAVTEGAIEPSLIQVTAIEPGKVTPLADVEERLRTELATRAAREKVNDLYDQVEDERAGGATLEEAGKKLSLPYRIIEAISEDGKTPDGGAISDIANLPQLVREAFQSDIGVENSPVRGQADSWSFFEVLDITPARDRTLDEVRDEAVAAWKEAETESRIAAAADKLFERLKAGTTLEALAAETGKPVLTVEQVKRGPPPTGLTANAAAQAFAGPEGHVANADGDGHNRIILRVDRLVAPAFFAEADDAKTIREQLKTAFENDVLGTFNQQLREGRAISVNNAVYQQVVGQLSGQLPPQ